LILRLRYLYLCLHLYLYLHLYLHLYLCLYLYMCCWWQSVCRPGPCAGVCAIQPVGR
jgi:hypothetical protein